MQRFDCKNNMMPQITWIILVSRCTIVTIDCPIFRIRHDPRQYRPVQRGKLDIRKSRDGKRRKNQDVSISTAAE